MRPIILILAAISVATLSEAQTFEDKITRELSFEKKTEKNALVVANINGAVQVTGYDGDKILLEVNRWIYGKTDARLEKGKQEVQLGVIDRADTLILYVEDGCTSFGARGKGDSWNGLNYGYNWDCRGRNCDKEYDYKMDFSLRVPRSVNLIVSTVNEGNVSVSNVKGAVSAYNVNGSIKLSDLTREAIASTVNGDVDIDYVANPAGDCRFYSLNGDINANFRKGLAASMSFESFNGDFYSNISDLTPLPVSLVQTAEGEGIKYKVTGNRYRIGKGSNVFLDFETFNGDVYLKEN